MAGPGPWSVKGVDESTRDTARAAARRAGLPIGVWLDRAILKATEAEIAPATTEAAAETPAEAGSTETTTMPAAESATTVAQDERAAPEPFPAQVAPADVKPVRPAASLLDIPPPSEERVESIFVSSAPMRRRGGFVRYGIGGMIALVLIGGIVAYVSELGDDSSSAPTMQISAPDREAPATAAATTKATPPAPRASAPQSNVAQSSPGAGPRTAPPTAGAAANSDAQLKALATRATGGDAEAEYELALRYSAGRGVPKDGRLAAEWFEKAAVHGFAPAQYNLGVLFERGQGVAKSPEKAFFWYQSAAQQHYARAEHNLATLYATGSGVAQNYGEAAKWFREAADAGISESLYSLGLMYEHGLGVARDIAMARTYYRRAAEAGSADARSKLAALGGVGETPGAADMTAAARLAEAVAPSAGGNVAPTPGSNLSLDRRNTAELQRLLARLDFAPGAADGVAGRRTVAAIKLYQEFAGLPVDGKATVGLLADVRDVSKTLGRTPRRTRQ